MQVGIVRKHHSLRDHLYRGSFYSPLIRWRHDLARNEVSVQYLTSEEALSSDWDVLLIDDLAYTSYPLYPNSDQLLSELKSFRQRAKRLVWLDNQDGSGNTRFEVLDIVDAYVKRHLLRDPTRYLEASPHEAPFEEHYHDLLKNMGVEVPKLESHSTEFPKKSLARADFPKIRISWTFAYMDIFSHRYKRLARILRGGFSSSLPSDRNSDFEKIGALFTGGNENIRDAVRSLALNEAEKYNWRTLGHNVTNGKFQSRIKECGSIVSPFGHGEMCLRDFEAGWFSKLLFKPSIEHLITFPNCLIPYESYIPLSWNPTEWGQEVNDGLETQDLDTIALELHKWSEQLGSSETRDEFISHFYYCILQESGCDNCLPNLWS